MKVVWLTAARADVRRFYDFLIVKDPRAAERAVRAIRLGADRLEENPRIGRRMDNETERRELFIPFGVGAYVLRYRIHGEALIVIRVWHSREHRA